MFPVVKYLGDQNPFTGDPEGDANVESDCEGDSSEVTNGFPEIERREEVLLRAVLTVGSLSACVVYSHLSIRFLSPPRLDQNDEFPRWKSLFFYCCTDEISFAPLRSQGVDSRSGYIRKTVAANPPPCSPKSIYVLANLVRRPSVGSYS